VNQYLIAFLVIFVCNVVPAFAPPTWSILVFFSLNHHMSAPTLILTGVIAATVGRGILAWYFRRYRDRLPQEWVTNMENAGSHLTKSKGHTGTLLGLFLLSPLSSAQLFEAAGIMKSIPLKPLLVAFAVGRSISYTSYVTGATVLKASSLGELIARYITSPGAIALQLLLILAMVFLGTIKWQPHIPTQGELPPNEMSIKEKS